MIISDPDPDPTSQVIMIRIMTSQKFRIRIRNKVCNILISPKYFCYFYR